MHFWKIHIQKNTFGKLEKYTFSHHGPYGKCTLKNTLSENTLSENAHSKSTLFENTHLRITL